MHPKNKQSSFDTTSEKPECHSRISELGEFELIHRLVSLQSQPLPKNIIGPGDDCAVLPSSFFQKEGSQVWNVITTDAMVEGRHFLLDVTSAQDLGWKLGAVTVSDIAAMGGSPKVALVNLQLRPDIETQWVQDLYRGLYALAEHHQMYILGGNIVGANELAFTMTAWGLCAKPPLLRGGARPGDELWVSGEIGSSGAGLAVLKGELQRESFSDFGAHVLEKHRKPMAQVELGEILLERGLATAMIDISDGLFQDAEHIATQSQVQLELNESAIPFGPQVLGAGFEKVAALTAGEDYELLFSASKQCSKGILQLSREKIGEKQMPPLTNIGRVLALEAENTPPVMIRTQDGQRISSREFLVERKWTKGGGHRHF